MSWDPTPEILALAPAPEGSRIGTDGRLHHDVGFSFMSTAEKCAAAKRSVVSASSIASAGERGTALHAILETGVKHWVSLVEQGQAPDFADVVRGGCHGLHPSDAKAVNRIAEEIRVFFVPGMKGMVVGTEEMIYLRDPVDGRVRSLGWYDVLVIIAEAALVVDHKFVRKEVDGAEVNRQGHSLAVAVFQTYPDVMSVTVLFSMPDCESSMHTFTRGKDFQRIEAELMEILDARERPFKTLRAGEHCIYCEFKATCPASVGAVKEMATAIEPMSVPSTFNILHVHTPAQMAILRYWCAVLEPIIAEIKLAATEMAKGGAILKAQMGPETLEYRLTTRSSPRKLESAIDIWNVLKAWMPAEAFITACKTSVTSLEAVAVQLLSDRLLSEGKEPNGAQLATDFEAMLTKASLLTREEGQIYVLRRKKSKGSKLGNGPVALPSSDDE